MYDNDRTDSIPAGLPANWLTEDLDGFGTTRQDHIDLEAERVASEARRDEQTAEILDRHQEDDGPIGLSFPSDADEVEYCEWLDDVRRARDAELDETRREYWADIASGLRRVG